MVLKMLYLLLIFKKFLPLNNFETVTGPSFFHGGGPYNKETSPLIY